MQTSAQAGSEVPNIFFHPSGRNFFSGSIYFPGVVIIVLSFCCMSGQCLSWLCFICIGAFIPGANQENKVRTARDISKAEGTPLPSLSSQVMFKCCFANCALESSAPKRRLQMRNWHRQMLH